jgi:hypothetical protein
MRALAAAIELALTVAISRYAKQSSQSANHIALWLCFMFSKILILLYI